MRAADTLAYYGRTLRILASSAEILYEYET